MIKAILFDMVGPVLMKRPDYTLDEVAERAEVLWRECKDNNKLIQLLKTDRVTKGLSVDEVADHVVGKFCKIPEVWNELLPILRSKYKLAIINNGMGITVPLFKSTFNFSDFFELFINSAEEKVEKPSPGIFNLTCQKLGVVAADCVFVDDLATNVEGAIKVGMKGLIYDNYFNFKEQLENLLLYKS